MLRRKRYTLEIFLHKQLFFICNIFCSFKHHGVCFLQELLVKEQEKVAEVSRVRVELQEQMGHLEAERTGQGALKEKISVLEREIKGFLHVIIYLNFLFLFYFKIQINL